MPSTVLDREKPSSFAPSRPRTSALSAPLVDWLQTRDDVDTERIGLYGVSLGGYYAVRAAAFEPRLRATIELAGTYSLAETWDDRSAISKAVYERRSGARNGEEAREFARTIDMAGLGEKVRSPLLIVHGKLDPIAPFSGAERLAADTPGAELVAFEDGNHGMTNRVFESRSLMGDWLLERLSG